MQIASSEKFNFATHMDDEIVQIAGGDEVKLRRLREIVSWFDYPRQLAASVQLMRPHLIQKERDAIKGVAVDGSLFYIQYLLWAMEQSDSPRPDVRMRWWNYRSKIEKPEEQEPSFLMVPLVVVPWDPVPEESSLSNCRRRNKYVPTSLPRRSPRFPCHSTRLMGQRSAVEE